MPRVTFGFDAQSVPGEHLFLSYSRGDAGRIRGIALELHRMGLPIWYDNGLIPGNLWKKEILREVKQSRMTVFFLTKDLFRRDRTFMIEEYQFAKDHSKSRVCIWLDDIGNMDCTSLDDEMYLWWSELSKLQSIEVFHLQSDAERAKEIYEGICRKDSGFRKYAAPAPKPQPAPVRQPQPAQVSQPKPDVRDKPDAAPVLKDSEPKPTKSAAKTTAVKRTPLIITVAIVLVVAIVGSVWATIGLGGKPEAVPSKSDVKSTESEIVESSEPVSSEIPALSQLTSVSVGDHFTFGNYPQGSNGEEKPIEWRVLAVEDGKALVISEKLLNCVKYNNIIYAVTWETCTLRSWMNNDFLNQAFSSSEQKKIATVTNQNPDNSTCHTEGGNATQDKIFTLSIDEVYQYFSNDADRMVAPTEYAIQQDPWMIEQGEFDVSLPSGEKTGWWWLRSPGNHRSDGATVADDGSVVPNGAPGDCSNGVRPAYWLNLSK